MWILIKNNVILIRVVAIIIVDYLINVQNNG